METSDELYSYFLQALKHYIKMEGHGVQKVLSIDSGVSRSMLSQILSDNSPKNALMKTQVDLAKACGYSFEEFLEIGRKLLNGEYPEPHEKSSGINPNKKHDAKVGNGMESDKDLMLSHYRDELKYLRAEVEKLRESEQKLKEAIKRERERAMFPDTEKKTAV